MDNLCTRCGVEAETIEHAPQIVVGPNCFGRLPHYGLVTEKNRRGLHSRLDDVYNKTGDSDRHAIFVMLLWTLWDARNKLTFSNHTVSHEKCFQLATSRLDEHQQGIEKQQHVSYRADLEHWRPPEDGIIKINSDASAMENRGTGLGAILRNGSGHVVNSSMKMIEAASSVEVAEALACREGV
ncbi:hypothetical protein DH2020_039353 [Rehmannia glutinosa]|uniref:RNase H type-1 domain-containing protein n=1 Tax=Rehmannia glutinosa TaxID=99300 RepID=A0ABR0UW94_REHGL